MATLKDTMKSITKAMNSLSTEIVRLEKRLDKLEAGVSKAYTLKRRKKAVAKKATAKGPKKGTAKDSVYTVISKSKKGVGMAVLKKRTGFNDKKIANIINRLKKEGKIATPKRGVYVKT